jgi:hypothetical protein
LYPGQVLAIETTASDASSTPSPFASEVDQGLLSPSDVVSLLHTIPTFSIVDEKGVPFTVVGEDAKVTAYFFTTYGEANRLLQLASRSSDKAIARAKREYPGEDIGSNPWKAARISSVPLDVAVTLVGKSNTRTVGAGNYFKVAPAESDVEDALAATGKSDLPEGRVPLFYYANFTITQANSKDGTTEKQSPLYFRKLELEQEFKRQNPGTKLPELLVSELFSVLAEMVRPGGTDLELKTLAFIAPRESEQKKKECDRKGGTAPALLLGQRIIVL